jgi:hypothetical protein
MAEDEYRLTEGKAVSFIGILFIIIGLMGFIPTGFAAACTEGYCNLNQDFFQAFFGEFDNNLTYNVLLLALIVIGISFFVIGGYLGKTRWINMKRSYLLLATLVTIVIVGTIVFGAYYLDSGYWSGPVPPNIVGSISFDNATVNSATQITAYLRNSGTKTESFGTVYVDDVLITNVSFTPATIAPNEISIVVIMGVGTIWNNGSVHAVTIMANDGSPCTINVQS